MGVRTLASPIRNIETIFLTKKKKKSPRLKIEQSLLSFPRDDFEIKSIECEVFMNNLDFFFFFSQKPSPKYFPAFAPRLLSTNLYPLKYIMFNPYYDEFRRYAIVAIVHKPPVKQRQQHDNNIILKERAS